MRLVLGALLALTVMTAPASGTEPVVPLRPDSPITIPAPDVPISDPAGSVGGIEEFPRLVRWEPPGRSGAATGDTLAHFMVCQVDLDEAGRPDTVWVLGCEGAKGALCDTLIRALRSAEFRPARRGGRPVASTCVFGVTFPAGRLSTAEAGIPVIGFWADSLCAYQGRIYGSAELAPESRPVVTRRARAAYPEPGRGYPAVAQVNLRAVVDPDGEPCFVLCDSAVPPDRGFVEAAVSAAFRFRYSPGKQNGHAQAVWVHIDFRWDPREWGKGPLEPRLSHCSSVDCVASARPK